jgi:hypothetical protein
MGILVDRCIDDYATLIDKKMSQVGSTTAEGYPRRCAPSGEDFSFRRDCKLISGANVDQSTVSIENRNAAHLVVEKFEDVFAWGSFASPNKVPVHKTRERDAEVPINEESAADVAIRHAADDP